MSNGNQKNEREEFPESNIMELDLKKEDLDTFKKRIKDQIRKFREFPPKDQPSSKNEESAPLEKNYSPKEKKPACFFLKAVDIYLLSNIPNFQGMSISIGLDDDEHEVLFLFPVTKRSDPEAVVTQDSTLNGETKTTSTVVMLNSGKTPCPPYPYGMDHCP